MTDFAIDLENEKIAIGERSKNKGAQQKHRNRNGEANAHICARFFICACGLAEVQQQTLLLKSLSIYLIGMIYALWAWWLIASRC